ncbi:hypothetical protein V8F20_000710 [Naviculisporaceae sp. PSN 640]
MTLHTSQCRRVLHRQLRSSPSSDSIWISDHILSAAFNRYYRISKAGRRNVGHVPGPLEAQRRLGKRPMGDMYFQQQSSAPLWAFTEPLNLSQWTWKAPKTPTEVRGGIKTRLWTRVMQWLESLAYPELHDPKEIELDSASSLTGQGQATLRDELDAFLSIPRNESRTILELAARDFFAKFQEAIRLGTVPLESILPTFQETWQALETIYTDRPGGQKLFADLCSSLVAGISASKVLEPRHFDAIFWAQVVTQVSKLVYEESLCQPLNQIMVQLARLRFGVRVAEVWLQIMDYIPAKSTPAICDGVLSMLDAAFETWSRPNRISSWHVPLSMLLNPTHDQSPNITTRAATVEDQEQLARKIASLRQTRIMASALRHFTTKEHIWLLNKATNKLLMKKKKELRSRRAFRSIRYNWACVLAQMPGVGQSLFFEHLARLTAGEFRVPVFYDHQLCSLLFLHWLHWERRGHLRQPKGRRHRKSLADSVCKTYDHWYEKTGGGKTAFVCFAMAVWWKTPHDCHTTLLRSFGSFLRKLNRLKDLDTFLEHAILSPEYPIPGRLLPMQFLQQVARTVNDPHVAIKLHHLFTNAKWSSPSGPTGGTWDPSVFKQYVSAIIHDKTIPPGKLWEVLDMEMYQGRGRTRRTRTPEQELQLSMQHLGIYGRKRAEIVLAAMGEFASASHLTHRVAFRHVEQCVHFLERYHGVLPVEVVEVLYKVVTRDLKEGRKGRLSRLRWFVKVLERNYGGEMAGQARTALFKWRDHVKVLEFLKEAKKARDELEAQQAIQSTAMEKNLTDPGPCPVEVALMEASAEPRSKKRGEKARF